MLTFEEYLEETNQASLYSLRWSSAKGAFWSHERNVTDETADPWLKEFQKAEPNVKFVISTKKPKVTKSDTESVRPKSINQ